VPRFKGGASGLSPLTIQLTSTVAVEVVGWYAAVDTEPGIATVVSRPVISRPSLLGTSPGTQPTPIIGVGNPSAVSSSVLLPAFGTPPSLPSVSPYTTLEPFAVQWGAAPGSGLLVPIGAGLLLYALASGAAAWNGQLEWDEP